MGVRGYLWVLVHLKNGKMKNLFIVFGLVLVSSSMLGQGVWQVKNKKSNGEIHQINTTNRDGDYCIYTYSNNQEYSLTNELEFCWTYDPNSGFLHNSPGEQETYLEVSIINPQNEITQVFLFGPQTFLSLETVSNEFEDICFDIGVLRIFELDLEGYYMNFRVFVDESLNLVNTTIPFCY